jgi:DNA-directed RNA polymerase specialized sigma24 family protein
VDLVYYGGLTHQEIADHVGVPLGTVKGRLRLALEKLRDSLRPPDPRDDGMKDKGMKVAG